MYTNTYGEKMISIVTQEKFFKSADQWLWSYCHYLGSVTVNGSSYDLGIYISDTGSYSYAIAYGDNPGDYQSGYIYSDYGKLYSHIIYQFKNNSIHGVLKLTYDLAVQANLLRNVQYIITDESLPNLFQADDVTLSQYSGKKFKLHLFKNDPIICTCESPQPGYVNYVTDAGQIDDLSRNMINFLEYLPD